MTTSSVRLLRDYENKDLPLEIRLPSLARRFPCLKGAAGLMPFSKESFHRWVLSTPKDSQAGHAGRLILNLAGKGPWEPFDVIAAISTFDAENREVFVNWARSWS
jgi:hypothetical protein